MINQAKSDKNKDIFLNFVADTLGLKDIKICDNFFLSLNFSELAHFSSLLFPTAISGLYWLKKGMKYDFLKDDQQYSWHWHWPTNQCKNEQTVFLVLQTKASAYLCFHVYDQTA